MMSVADLQRPIDALVSGVFLPLSAAVLGLGLRARRVIDRQVLAPAA
jgi:hypothetical protein